MTEMDTVRPFGALADGRAVRAARLAWEGGLEVVVLEYGAIIHKLIAPARGGPVQTVLGFDTLAEYEADRDFHGCVCGRVANRIGGAQFELDGEVHHLAANQGPNALHGGVPGFNKRLWTFASATPRRVELDYVSPDGESGFPGTLDCRIVFDLVAPDALEITWEARCDRATPVNLTHHPYFNLSGRPRTPILDHELMVAGGAVLPVRVGLIPTGELLSVEHTPFDLRQPKRIGDQLAMQHGQLALPRGFDLNWALDAEVFEDDAYARRAHPAAALRSPESGLVLRMWTDQPGVQVYSGQGLGYPFVPHGALVLEPQGYPDAPNQPTFPSVTLRPGELYRRHALYRFEAGPAG